MARNECDIDATPEEIFEVFLDASKYARWVVGAKTVRGVDADWPAPGAAFHHSVGVGALHIKDKTSIEELDAPRRLVLRARALPAGVALVTLTVNETGPHSSHVEMDEVAIAGLANKLPQKMLDPLIHARNAESLRRLTRVAEEYSSLQRG